MTTTGFKAGLEDVIAARSAICQVDGSAGRLYYRGCGSATSRRP